jgi:hypothetical protein
MLSRFFAGVVLALVVAVALGGCMTAIAGRAAPRGEFVDLGGRNLRLVCQGPETARPVVWFEHGAFGQAEDFAAVQRRLTAPGCVPAPMIAPAWASPTAGRSRGMQRRSSPTARP